MKIVDADAIRRIDKRTVAKEPIPEIDLMERASHALVEQLIKEISPAQPIYVFGGTGNNGGDAFATARLLFQQHFSVTPFLLGKKESTTPSTRMNIERLEHLNILVQEVLSQDDFPSLSPPAYIIDGLFGSGLSRPTRGLAAQLIKHLNDSCCSIYSIDIPSGLYMSDNRHNEGCIVRATKTYCLQLPKLAALLPESGEYFGEWEVIPIGLLPQAIDAEVTPLFYVQPPDVVLPQRPRFAHKGTFGHALLIAGSERMAGAAVLAAQGCLHAGTGLLTCHLPQKIVPAFQAHIKEAIVSLDKNETHWSRQPRNLSDFHVCGIGPGIGKHPRTRAALFQTLKTLSRLQKPLLLDADALTLLATRKEKLSLLPPKTILTPHPKEFERLFDTKSTSRLNQIFTAQKQAKKYQIIIILKGAYTATVLPSGDIFFNSSGHSGMATAGSGDVLTGIITGFVASGMSPERAAIAAVYWHGKAADFALQQGISKTAFTASEYVRHLPFVLP